MPAASLVGRSAETAALHEAFDHVVAGQARAVEVVGDPGIGKSRLLGELGEVADARGALVLQGAASELETDLPFAVFVDALDEFVHGLPRAVLDTLAAQTRSDLADVLPSVRRSEPAGARRAPHERYRSHGAVRDLLETAAARTPVVVVLDDLHWADWASAELLMALVRRPPAAGVLLALGRRPRHTDSRLAAALDRAQRAGALTRLEPGPLTKDESHELLGGRLSPAEADRVHRECGGNPFYVTEFARSPHRLSSLLAETPSAVVVGGATVPAGVATALHEELDQLDGATRRLGDGAAVAGDPFELGIASAAAGLDEPTAAASLDRLLRLGLVRTTDVPSRFRFRHPIVRRAVYDLTGAAWRLRAHRRCAEALRASGASLTTVAGHVERSARSGDLDAVAVLRDAGDRTLTMAPASSARFYAAALDVLPADGHDDVRVSLLLPRSGALVAVGDYAASYECLTRCLMVGPDAMPVPRVQLIASCAGLEQLLGRHTAARDRLLAAVRELPEHDSAESAAFLAELAMVDYFALRYDDMAEKARRALAIAERAGDVSLRTVAGAALCLAGALSASPRIGEDCSRAARLVDGTADDVVLARLDAVGHLAYSELMLERFADAARHADRVVLLSEQTGHGQLLPLVVPIQAAVHAVHGELPAARGLMEDAVEAARLTCYDRAIVWTLANRSAVRLQCGDVDGALADAQESAERVRELDETLVRGWTAARLGSAQLAAGRPDLGLGALEELGGGRTLDHVQGGERAVALEVLTRCLIELGDLDEARAAAERARVRADDYELDLARASSARASAACELAGGGAGAADTWAAQAVDLADASDAPVEAAVSQILAGRSHEAAGRRHDAVHLLRRAAQTLHDCGAHGWRRAAEHELRRWGESVPRRSVARSRAAVGLEVLSERERQIAALVATGATNAAIALELYLSVKTVESHLRNVFHKLDVTSRAQVAHRVALAGTPVSTS